MSFAAISKLSNNIVVVVRIKLKYCLSSNFVGIITNRELAIKEQTCMVANMMLITREIIIIYFCPLVYQVRV